MKRGPSLVNEMKLSSRTNFILSGPGNEVLRSQEILNRSAKEDARERRRISIIFKVM